MKKTVLFSFCALAALTACKSTKTAAISSEKTKIMAIIDRVNQKWQADHAPEAATAFWHPAAYHTGNMAVYEITKNHNYLDYSIRWAEKNQWKGAKTDDKNRWKYKYGETDDYVLFGDWQTCFQVYIDLYNLQKDEQKIARAREVFDYQISMKENDFWWWVDALYMAMPVMSKLEKITGDKRLLDKQHDYFAYTKHLLFDNESGLFFRDAKYIFPEHKTKNGKKDFWARGNGWAFAALAKVLQDLPATSPYRSEYITVFKQMAAALKPSQTAEGYWSRSILDTTFAAGRETSGTAFFAYGLYWGMNNGFLDKKEYEPTAERAWKYLTTIALQEDGTVGYVQPIGERADQHVVGERTAADFGTGAFLLAACEKWKWTR